MNEEKVDEELDEYVDKQLLKFKKNLSLTVFINIAIIFISIKCFMNYILEIYFALGVIGTGFVGWANYSSEKLIKQYSSTKLGYNPDIAKALCESKYYTSIGTVFLLFSVLLGYMIQKPLIS